MLFGRSTWLRSLYIVLLQKNMTIKILPKSRQQSFFLAIEWPLAFDRSFWCTLRKKCALKSCKPVSDQSAALISIKHPGQRLWLRHDPLMLIIAHNHWPWPLCFGWVQRGKLDKVLIEISTTARFRYLNSLALFLIYYHWCSCVCLWGEAQFHGLSLDVL